MASVEHCLYCFEALSASLENRTPMTLYQVQASWASYPKGLEDTDDTDETDSFSESEEAAPKTSLSPPPRPGRSSSTKSKPKPRIPVLQRLARSTSSSSSSSPISSSSLAPDTTATTPDRTYSPVGLHPRRTSQRSSTITSSPLFVTWNIVSPSSSRELRGCIGTFETQPLASGLSSYALISALQDHRFPPISLAELPKLEVSVTLLTDFEDTDDAMEWDLGVHGLRISFYAKNKRYGACYLPDVPVEQGWTKEETIFSLMEKAGWRGKREKWREVGDFKTVRFQGKAESLGWEEFRRWREWVNKGAAAAK
ncbi:ammecr1 family protein [Diplocarpon rosae]|nr:ammecr1 family protein [Diplocarpon rosae]